MATMNTISKYYGTRPFRISVEQEGKKKENIDGCDDIALPSETWPRLVNEYTRCNLTKPEENILVALAGIARQYSVLHNDKYCAGLWLSELLWQIPWFVEGKDRQPASHQSTPETHPTWSWASVKRQIWMIPWTSVVGTKRLLATVPEIEVMLLDSNNPFGAMKASSHLTLRGLLFPILDINEGSLRFQTSSDHSTIHKLNPSFDYEGLTELQSNRVHFMPIVMSGSAVHALILYSRLDGKGFERIGKSCNHDDELSKFLSQENADIEAQRQLVQIC
jgi:hypothetical protein